MRLDYFLRKWWATPLKQTQKRIRLGEVRVNGITCTEPKYNFVPGVEVVHAPPAGSPSGSVPVAVPCDGHLFCLMNKPTGHVCQRHPREPNVYNLLPAALRRPDLAAFGRLDRDTTGMLLFGTDGGVQSLLLHPNSRVWKTYTATLRDGCCALAPDAAARFEAGLVLEDGLICAPAYLERIDTETVRVRVHEGHFHQVKRMLAHVGGDVASLHRDAFGALADAALPAGEARPLRRDECEALLGMLPLDRLGAKIMEHRHAGQTDPPTEKAADETSAPVREDDDGPTRRGQRRRRASCEDEGSLELDECA